LDQSKTENDNLSVRLLPFVPNSSVLLTVTSRLRLSTHATN